MNAVVRQIFGRLHELDPDTEEAKLNMVDPDSEENELRMSVQTTEVDAPPNTVVERSITPTPEVPASSGEDEKKEAIVEEQSKSPISPPKSECESSRPSN